MNMKQLEKNKTRKKCYSASRKKVQYEKKCNMKRVQDEKSITWKKCNSKRVQPEE